MLLEGSVVNVVDGGGVLKAKVIGKVKCRHAKIGSLIKVVPRLFNPSKFTKKNVLLAMVVHTVYPLLRKDGSTISFQQNSVILVKKDKKGLLPISKTVPAYIPQEVLTILSGTFSHLGRV